MQPKLIVNFARLSEADFLARAGLIIASLEANPRFPEPWPAPAPSLQAFTAAYDSYRSAYHASTTRDGAKISQRNAARQALTEMLKHLAQYLEFVARGDAAALASTNYELRREISRIGGAEPLLAPEGFKVQHGAFSGSLNVRVNRVAGAGSYEVQITQGDPTVDANWKHVLTSVGSTRITLNDLPPMQSLWVRVRGVGANGGGRWTEPVNIIVV